MFTTGALKTLWDVVRNLKLDSRALRHPGLLGVAQMAFAKGLAGFSVVGGGPHEQWLSLRVSSRRPLASAPQAVPMLGTLFGFRTRGVAAKWD